MVFVLCAYATEGRTLSIVEVSKLKKPNEFLEDMTTRSKRDNTKNTYCIALAHLQTFLKNSHDYNGYEIETILE